MKNIQYVLDDDDPRGYREEPDLTRWADWFGTEDRKILHTRVKGGFVSTVFLGLDHNFGDGPPLLWETMSKIDGEWGDQQRYPSAEEAVAGHHAVVRRLEGGWAG
jgi:hypothetical protein